MPNDRALRTIQSLDITDPTPAASADSPRLSQRRRARTRSASKSRRKASTAPAEDRREHRRYSVAATLLRVTWQDTNGDLQVEEGAQPIDVSEKGMAVQLPEPALLLSRVQLESDQGELLGHGKVRSCRAAGEKYVVGIEFTDSLRWSPPEGPVNEPIPLLPPISEVIPCSEPDASQAAAAGVPEELLWSEAPANASRESTDAFQAPAPELHLWQNSGAGPGFLARLPIAAKVAAPVVFALAISALFLAHNSSTPASSGGNSIASSVGEQGWITEWASDAGGSRHGRQITLYRPSASLSNYQMQFTGQIENKALGWVIRAADTKNYYGMKIANDQPGSVRYTRFAIVHGRESAGTEKRLPIQARADTAYRVRVEANGPRFSVYVQDEAVDLWTDNRLAAGALGFMNEAEESGRTNSVLFSFRDGAER